MDHTRSACSRSATLAARPESVPIKGTVLGDILADTLTTGNEGGDAHAALFEKLDLTPMTDAEPARSAAE